MELFGNFIPEDLEKENTSTSTTAGNTEEIDIKEAEGVLTTDKKDLPEDIKEKTERVLTTKKPPIIRDMPTFKEMEYWEEIRREGGWGAVKELGGWEAVWEIRGKLTEQEKKEAAITQSIELSTEKVITSPLLNGFMWLGSANLINKIPTLLKIDPETKRVLEENRVAEVMIVDREKDPVLKEMCEWAESLKDLSIEEKTFLIAREVYNRMGKDTLEAVDGAKKLAKSKEDILIGEAVGRGVCRHRALLFHILAREAGIDSCIRVGCLIDLEGYEKHAWNEIIDENGEIRVVDITRSIARDFDSLSYKEYKKKGGLPEPGTSRLGKVCYLDLSTEMIYTGARIKFTEENLKNMKKYYIKQGYSKEETERMVQDKIIDLDKREVKDEGLLKKKVNQFRKEVEQLLQAYFKKQKEK